MMIKSAFITTAYQGHDYDAFNWGAGHVDPNKAVDPGLVFDSNLNDWLAFLKVQKLYNDLAGSQTVARSATSVGSTSETYTFSTTGLPGLSVTPSVTSFIAAPRSVTPWTVSFLCTLQAVIIGQTIPTTFGWSGLPAGNRYLGRVQYVDAAAPSTAMASTVIGVST